jgi:PKHD-type hydroxylase
MFRLKLNNSVFIIKKGEYTMQYPVKKYNLVLPKFGVMNNALSQDEVERILFLEKILKFDSGKVGGENNLNKEARNSNIAFLPIDENTDWLYQKIASLVSKVNYDLFMLDIDHIETLQYTIYSSDEEQHYDWHLDAHPVYETFARKISGSISLSNPSDYEGGELEVITNGRPDESQMLKPNIGEIAFFSSEMPHKVHPVTSGVRKSLVFWVRGRRES